MRKEEVLAVYDDLILSNKEYQEMIRIISSMVSGSVLEIGAGTGLLTKEVVEKGNIDRLVVVEPDSDFLELLIKKRIDCLAKNKGIDFEIRKEDAMGGCCEGERFDYVIMSLVYHHIPDDKKLLFLKKMRSLSKKGVVIGDLFIPSYSDEKERDEKLIIFHKSRIDKMDNELFKKIELKALRDGLRRDGEWKSSSEVIDGLLRKAGFDSLKVIDVGDQEAGGYKIFICH